MKLLHSILLLLFFVHCLSISHVQADTFSSLTRWFSNVWNELFPARNDKAIEKRITQVLQNSELDNTLGYLFTGMQSFNRTIDQVNWCYAGQLGEDGRIVHIFDESVRFKNVAVDYYKAFPTKPISYHTLSALLNSTREIINRCIDLTYRRPSVRFGFTSLSDKSHEEVAALLGNIQPTQNQLNSVLKRRKRLTGADTLCQPDYSRNVPNTYDWRNHGVVTPVKFQGNCGSDWIFAAVGSIESALLVHQKTLRTNLTMNLSEQQLLDCTKSDGCTEGGNSRYAFGYVKNYGISEDKVVPYLGKVEPCPYAKVDYYYPITDYCIRSRYAYSRGARTERLSDLDIQRSLLQFGPLYTLVDSNPEIFQNYREGVIADQSCTDRVNHSVLLVGYTQDAWIVKNSWSDKWGEKGYFRLARGRNMCGINSEIAWPLL